jgi:hypothetical protein
MTFARKADNTGRSTDKPARSRVKNALGMPKGVGYCIPIPRMVLESPALAVLPLRARRVLDGLMAAWAGEGGTANGQFTAAYDALVAQGVRRDVIRESIADLEAVGLVCATRGVRSFGTRRVPSTYRLTWLGTPDGLGPTNEWRAIQTTEEAETRLTNARAELERERTRVRDRRAAWKAATAESGVAAAESGVAA